MNLEQLIGLSLAWFIMLIGVVGSIIPAIPSTTLVLLSAILHRLYFHETGAGNWVLVFMGIVAAFSLILDYLATMIGARKLGATWRGILGSCLGAIVGAFLGFLFIGIFVGTFLGAVLFELSGGRKLDEATRAGLGALIGLLGGALGKLACSVAMVAVFSVSVISNSLPSGTQPKLTEPPPEKNAYSPANDRATTTKIYRIAFSTHVPAARQK